MWHTSRGDRTLIGDEAALICRAIDEMVSALVMYVHEDFEERATDCDSGIVIYDTCTPSQRIAMLHQVSAFLLRETEDALPLNALMDATVAAIFVEIRDQVAIEIDLGNKLDVLFSVKGDSAVTQRCSWREMVRTVHLRCFDQQYDLEYQGDQEDIPDSQCEELFRWERLITDLSELSLWDRDFELAESFLDLDPGVSEHRRRLLGIDEHYFSAVPGEIDCRTVFSLAEQTRKLIRSIPR